MRWHGLGGMLLVVLVATGGTATALRAMVPPAAGKLVWSGSVASTPAPATGGGPATASAKSDPASATAGASPSDPAASAAVTVTGRPHAHASPASALATTAVPPAATQAFTDAADGYAITPPAGWTFDPSLLPDVARWNSPDASLRVYSQPTTDAATYVDYSNRSIDQQWNGIQLLQSTHSGNTWFRRWERPAMPLLQPDMRQYAEWDELMANGRVLTIMVNATGPGFAAAYAAAKSAAGSVRVLSPVGANGFAIQHAAARPAPLLPTAPGVSWGVYEPALNPEQPSLLPVDQLQQALGTGLKVVMVYLTIGDPFPAALLQKAQAQGKVVELTLQSWAPSGNAGRALPYANGTSADGAILQGLDDQDLRAFAQQAAATGIPFLFRWDNEMNGDWDPWSAFQWGKDTDIYVATYRHVHDIFAAAGATDAAFIWNPNNDDLPDYRWNAAALYYPGDAYVDWVGLTGYNLGAGQPGSTWRSFTQAYAASYARDRALYPGKPLIITEFASNDAGGDKAAWIADMFRALPSFPAIRYAVWWDADQGGLHYALSQPAGALAAMRAGLHP